MIFSVCNSGFRVVNLMRRVLGLNRIMGSLGALVLMLTMVPGLSSAVADTKSISDADMIRLKRGEIVLQTIHEEKLGGAARVTALFDSSAAAVWDIIGYCRYTFVYMRGLEFCEMVSGDQFQMTMHHRLRNSWYAPTLDFIFAASRDADGNGTAHLVEGNLKVMQGHWMLYPLADSAGLMVVHEVRIQPDIPAPKWLVRRSLRNDLPDMLACIRGLAKASGDSDLVNSDLLRCPGDISSLSN